MVVPTGTASPWREAPFQADVEGVVVYLRDGWESESADLLAEALRADGVSRSLRWAIPAAEAATLEVGWYGYVDGDNQETRCDALGETDLGERVDTPRPCMFALVDVRE